ncbi:uncharacterized protein LOC114368429 [Glycine soja]|uniref:uncharacterized protein LOC114368429 n=1 Tax=Glycine soja TaxID=3848 RepID=UPI001038989D|nr:uncharacterized protein LOC114368429 [Glycine soja]
MTEPGHWNPVLDRLEAAIAHFATTQASMAARLDVLLLKIDTLLISQHPPSSSFAQPPSANIPMPSSSPPMSIPLSCPVPMQQSQAPMLAPHLSTNSKHHVPHAPSSIFNQLVHARAVDSFNNLLSVVVHYGCAVTPHDKLLENRDMTLFEMGVESYGSAMVARKRQLAAFALWMAAKPSEFRRDRPWDPGITFGSHGLKPQHLEDKVFLMGQGMLGGRKQTSSKPLLRAQPQSQMENRITKTLKEFHITNYVRASELAGY